MVGMTQWHVQQHRRQHPGLSLTLCVFALVAELWALRQSALEERAQAEGISGRELVNQSTLRSRRLTRRAEAARAHL